MCLPFNASRRFVPLNRPFTFWADCYHYETRTRTVTYTDANGNTADTPETYQEKVVTNLSFEPVSFQYWKDTSSPELVGINDKGITKIKMTLSVEPGDEETAATIFEKYSAFQNKYRHFDVFVDFSMRETSSGLREAIGRLYGQSREADLGVERLLHGRDIAVLQLALQMGLQLDHQ